MKTRIMYLGPLAAISHTGPSGITRAFLRNTWTDDDYSEEDLKFYTKPGKAFKVERVVFKRTKVVPQVTEQEEEIIFES